MIGYVILENQDPGPITDESKLDYVGHAKSITAAERVIREDVRDHFAPGSINDDFSDYSSHYMICEIFGVIHPVPDIKVQIKLIDAG